jgi:acetylglutamate kinase
MTQQPYQPHQPHQPASSTGTTTVIKVGGNELDDPAFLDGLCRTLADFPRPVVLVHGGGKEITAALEHYGQDVRFVEGWRITPPASMAIMEMVVCGRINKRLVARLVQAGQPALGLSGVDLGLLRCVPYRPNGIDLGRVGTITAVESATLHGLLAPGWLPVFAPVALGNSDGLAYNVNADHVAQAIAAALPHPTELVYVSNVAGVLRAGAVVPTLTATETLAAIDDGTISGGMVPKVRAALAALERGVAAVRITNLAGLLAGGTRLKENQ